MTMIPVVAAWKPRGPRGPEFMEEPAMPWLSKADAARALGISSRTLTRGVADGMLEAKREGSRVLVHVRDDVSHNPPLSTRKAIDQTGPHVQQRSGDADRRSVETMAGSAGRQREDTGAVAQAMAAIRETHAAFEETASIARLGAQQAIAAQQRTVQHLKWVGTLSIAAVVVVVVVAGWTAWRYDQPPARQTDETHELGQGVADVDAGLAAASEVLRETLDADRQATATMFRELEDRLSKAQRAVFETQTQATAAVLRDLDQRFSKLAVALRTIEAGQHEIACEWDQLTANHEQNHLERAQLADRIDRLTQHLLPADPAPTLREIIDKDWNPGP